MVEPRIKVAVIDYGLGNLFSVAHACEHAGMEGIITSNRQEILDADAVILPGVGAFGGAMESLRKLDLIGALRDICFSDKPLLGICLGMQLLMTESHEFGLHEGLGIVEGSVVPLQVDSSSGRQKVPQVGWNRIYIKSSKDPLLAGIPDGEFMYFVHSFYVKPEVPDVILSITRYGDVEFCSAFRHGNVFACQFHPERSGIQGLKIYQNFAKITRAQLTMRKESHA